MILSSAPEAAGPAAAVLALGSTSLVALVGYAAAAWPGERFGGRIALLVAWVAHAAAIIVDIAGIGSAAAGARFGFAPALSMTVWLVLAVYIVESRFLPLPGVRRALAVIGAAVVVLAWSFPGELRPQAPTAWAPWHWVLGIASYGLFGAAVLHAAMLNRAERRLRQAAVASGLPLLRLERMTFGFVTAGFIVLSAALILGIGSPQPWRWDHKTVFSVLGWIMFAALLSGRIAFGWRGRLATRWLYAGAALLLLAYVGSRFVFEVVLHRLPPA